MILPQTSVINRDLFHPFKSRTGHDNYTRPPPHAEVRFEVEGEDRRASALGVNQ